MGYQLTIQHDGQLTEDQAEYHLNTAAMGRHVRLMIDIGMAYNSGDPTWDPHYPTGGPGTAPTIPSHKLNGSNDDWWTTAEEITAALAVWDAQAEDSTERIRDAHEQYTDLTADRMVEFYRRGLDQEEGLLDLGLMHPDEWAAWIDYLRLAAAHDGFRNS